MFTLAPATNFDHFWHSAPRSLSVEGERGGPAWEEPEGFTRFSRLPGERRRLELGPGMGEQAGG